jgi:N-acetylmuramic acid 6-phosphate (MurNAc-6-P) etherase
MRPTTEQSSGITSSLDSCSAGEIVELLRRANDEEMFPALLDDPGLFERLETVAEALRADPEAILVLSGCGTSGRLAMYCVLAWGSSRVRHCISGGDQALLLPVENAEDDAVQGAADLLRVTGDAKRVVFVGITCGLSAPYVAGQLDLALSQRSRFVQVVLLGFNAVEAARNVAIEGWPGEGRTFLAVARRVAVQGVVLNPAVGPEPVTGSTRMKGGSATKMLLDCLWRRATQPDGPSARETMVRFRECCNAAYGEKERGWLGNAIESAAAALRAECSVLFVADNSLQGMLGLIDASECPPTFGAVPENVRAYVEGPLFGIHGIDATRDFAPRSGDCVVVIARDAAKRALYAEKARDAGATVVELPPFPDDCFGQMQLKLTLNAISTGAFVLFGKIFGNRMLDLRLSNNKLYHRAISIVAEIARVDADVARASLWRSIYRSNAPQCTEATAVSAHVQAASLRDRVVPVAILLASGAAHTVEEAVLRIAQTPKLRDCLNSAF